MDLETEAREIHDKLMQRYNERLSCILMGTWLRIRLFGDGYVRSIVNVRTHQRNIRYLLNAGIEVGEKVEPGWLRIVK